MLVLGGVGLFFLASFLPWAQYRGGEPERLFQATAFEETSYLIVIVALAGVAASACVARAHHRWSQVSGAFAALFTGVLAAWIVRDSLDPTWLQAETYDFLYGGKLLWTGVGFWLVGGAVALISALRNPPTRVEAS